jgi:hypothetical protein
MATDDELRAEQWQRDQATMSAQRAAIDAGLHGSSSARHQLHVDWDPVDQWLRERGQVIPVDCEDD